MSIEKKRLTDLPRIVYHGTISVYEESLRAGIDLKRGIQTTDFGKGFYTTTIRSQAERFAFKKASNFNRQHRGDLTAFPLLIEYALAPERLSECSGIVFDSPDDRWREFIFNNRVGIGYVISDFHNLNISCDFVYGAVADADIVKLTRDARNKKLDYTGYCNQLIPLRKGTGDQLSFHTERALKAIRLSKTIILREEAVTL